MRCCGNPALTRFRSPRRLAASTRPELDPKFVQARRLDCRARIYELLYGWSLDPKQDLSLVELELPSFREGTTVDPELPMTEALLSLIRGDGQAAEKSLMQISIAHRDPLAPLFLAKLRARAGRLEEADDLLRQAVLLDVRNLSWDIPATRAAVALAEGDDDAAVDLAETAIERGTESPQNMAEPWLIIAAGEAELGNLDAAEPALAIYHSMVNAPKPEMTFAGAISPRLAEGINMVDFAD